METETISQSFDDLLSWDDAGDLKSHISQIFYLADASKAMEMLKSRNSTGKLYSAFSAVNVDRVFKSDN